VNTINERLGVVDVASVATSKAPKTLRDRDIKDLSLIRLGIGLDMERAHGLSQRYIPSSILLIRLELEFSKAQRTENLATYRSLRSDRPYLTLAVHCSSDARRVMVLVFDCTPGS
jgi:hypothetical protein